VPLKCPGRVYHGLNRGTLLACGIEPLPFSLQWLHTHKQSMRPLL